MEDISRWTTLLFVLLLCTCVRARAQVVVEPPQRPDREIRGVWMATVLNIDYPQHPTPSAATLRADFDAQLRRLRALGVNAIFLQVRPAGDALYPSRYAPWSAYLTGTQGKPPVSGFDPLAHAVAAAHAVGVEVHAWVNPYRAAMTTDISGLAENHLYFQHNDWVHTYGGRMYLDPGLPAVRAHLGEVIDELIANYDLDGVHFDDYFYPYPRAGEAFPDSLTFAAYGGSQQLGDWRRANVNTFVAETHRRIKAAKPWVQFGISPFGVWRNRSQDPVAGSDTRASVSSYDDLYGDALHWARAGTVDYLLPQLYWSMDYAPAAHRTLADWWVRNTPPGVDLLIGHAAYKVFDNAADSVWNDPQEIPRQIANARRLDRVDGSVYFSAKSLLYGRSELRQALTQNYPSTVLLPERNGPEPDAAINLKVRRPKKTDAGNLVVWEVKDELPEEQLPHYYAIYRATEKDGPYTLVHRTPYGLTCRTLNFLDAFPEAVGKVKYRYRVVPLDRWHRPMVEVGDARVR